MNARLLRTKKPFLALLSLGAQDNAQNIDLTKYFAELHFHVVQEHIVQVTIGLKVHEIGVNFDQKRNIFLNKHIIYQNFTNFMQIKEIDVHKLESVIFGP